MAHTFHETPSAGAAGWTLDSMTILPVILPVGSRVCVTSYSPFRGLRGTIRTVDTISAELEEPFCFYQIELEGAYIKEPIWFEFDEVELVTPIQSAPSPSTSRSNLEQGEVFHCSPSRC